MSKDTLIAIFTNHEQAERAINDRADGKFDMTHLSIVGQGYHTEEKVVGFHNTGDRIKFWGTRGVFWGGLWGLFLGGVLLMVPVVGRVMVVCDLATVVASAVEGALVVGGLRVPGAALSSIGVPRDGVLKYETALKADAFLGTAHGQEMELARTRTILSAAKPSSLELHDSTFGVRSGVRRLTTSAN